MASLAKVMENTAASANSLFARCIGTGLSGKDASSLWLQQIAHAKSYHKNEYTTDPS